MRTIRNKRLVARYPWLAELRVNLDDVDIIIQRMDKDALLSTPSDEHAEGANGSSGRVDRYWTITNGQVTSLAIKGAGEQRYGGNTTAVYEAQPLIDQLVALSATSFDILVREHQDWSNWKGREFYDDHLIIIYLPKVSVTEVVAEAIRAEEARIDGELAQIQG